MTAYEALEVSAKAVRTRLQRWEMRVDGTIHVAAIIAALVGATILILIADHRAGAEETAAVAIYSCGLLAMFGCSAAYNLGRFTRHGNWLRGLDQSAIFLMIAGTYTPFTVIDLKAPGAGVLPVSSGRSRSSACCSGCCTIACSQGFRSDFISRSAGSGWWRSFRSSTRSTSQR